jgi:hypothetical protein
MLEDVATFGQAFEGSAEAGFADAGATVERFAILASDAVEELVVAASVLLFFEAESAAEDLEDYF